MRRTVLVAVGSGLVGGLAGAAAAIVVLRGPETSNGVTVGSAEREIAERGTGSAPTDAHVLGRLERVERALQRFESRRPAAGIEALAQRADGREPSAQPAAAEIAVLEAPAFEAAVLDILERAEEDRDSERDVRRNERAERQAEHWSNELTTRLSLTAAQASKARDIRNRLVTELREQRDKEASAFVPREQRRTAREALRKDAERELRALLAPSQVARYEELEGELKLVRPADAD